MFGVLTNPATERQRRTRNAILSAASYGAGSVARALAGKPSSKPAGVPRPLTGTNALVRATHEPKYANISVTGASGSISAYSSYSPLAVVTQGTAATNRTGRRILVDSWRLKLLLFQPSTIHSEIVRIILVRDNESRGSAASLGDVLQTSTFGFAAILSPWNLDNIPSRFQILADRTVPLTPSVPVALAGTNWNTPYTPIEFNVPVNKVTHFYNTTAGTVADIDSGNLMFFLQQTGGTSISLNYDSLVQFRDV
jgi:hypothetical protein